MRRALRTGTRRAVGLTEVVLAVAILGTLMLVISEQVRSSAQRTREGRDRVAARMLLMDLIEILKNRGPEELLGRLSPGGLDALMDVRLSMVPDPERAEVKKTVHALRGRLSGSLAGGLDPATPDLIRLNLRAECPDGRTVEVCGLYRPIARMYLPLEPDGDCARRGTLGP